MLKRLCQSTPPPPQICQECNMGRPSQSGISSRKPTQVAVGELLLNLVINNESQATLSLCSQRNEPSKFFSSRRVKDCLRPIRRGAREAELLPACCRFNDMMTCIFISCQSSTRMINSCSCLIPMPRDHRQGCCLCLTRKPQLVRKQRP